jgi:hypothetical protein
MMIKVTIEQTIQEEYEVTEQMVTKETPTEYTEEVESYGSRTNKKVQFAREYAPTRLMKTRERKVTLLEQEIEDESAFNLQAVIATINGIHVASEQKG